MTNARAIAHWYSNQPRRSWSLAAASLVISLAVVGGLWLSFDGGGGAVQAQTACETGGAAPEGGGLARDCSTLLGLKSQLAGTATLNWSADLAIASWDGVRVAGFPKRVTRLHLHAKGLTGTIPAALSQLDELQHLNLERNQLTGSIPGELGMLSKLTNLALGQNKLTGTIPAELATMAKLGSLYLRSNQLSGSLPEGLGTSDALWLVSVERNRLTGALPTSLSGLSVLWVTGNEWSCAPAALLKVQNNDLAGLDLPECAKATPTPTTHTLTLSAGTGGSLSADPAGPSYAKGTAVTVTATAGDGYKLSSWGDDCVGTQASSTTCSLTMDGDKTASAAYSRKAAASAFRYNRYDATGAVSAAGSYAFLSNGGETQSNAERASAGTRTAATVLTTYEGLRQEADTLRVHLTDADGVSRVAFYGTVKAGDVFEWRIASACWARYQVMSAPIAAELATDTTSRHREFGVKPLTYAFTGCSGAVAASTAGRADFGPLPDLGGSSLTAPVIHGIYQLVPAGWSGVARAGEVSDGPGVSHKNPVYTESLSEARMLPYWRDPDLPEGWRLDRASSGGLADPAYGYTAEYVNKEGYPAFTLKGYHADARYYAEEAAWNNGDSVRETRTIAGRPAVMIRGGPEYAGRRWPVTIWVYDEGTDSEYQIIASDWSLTAGRGNADAVIAIARSLFE